MSDQQHPITPPPELFRQWKGMPRSLAFEAAYRAGADAELEACCGWLDSESLHLDSRYLRADRRPEPPSLAEQALELVDRIEKAESVWNMRELDIIRHALERLQELENNG